jgi:hypothetical protein
MTRLFDALYNSKMLDKPKWIRLGLTIRKPLGLLALWFLGILIIMSLLLFKQKYYGKFFIDPKASSSKLSAIAESFFFFGILRAGFFFILGISMLASFCSQSIFDFHSIAALVVCPIVVIHPSIERNSE